MRINLFGELVVDVDENRCIVAPRSRGGRHLTVYFRPQPAGRYAGLLTPHTTAGRVRRTLAHFRPDRLRALAERLEHELVVEFLKRTRPVTPVDLDRQGWKVILPLEHSETAEMIEALRTRGSDNFRLGEATVRQMGKAFIDRAVSPMLLEDPDFPQSNQVWAVRAGDSGQEETSVLMFRSASTLGPSGWYATPVPFTSRDFVERLIHQCCGPNGVEKLKAVGRFLSPAESD
jgi:hypothetical protein